MSMNLSNLIPDRYNPLRRLSAQAAMAVKEDSLFFIAVNGLLADYALIKIAKLDPYIGDAEKEHITAQGYSALLGKIKELKELTAAGVEVTSSQADLIMPVCEAFCVIELLLQNKVAEFCSKQGDQV
ncbi:MAG: hypothetical protein COB66_01445 [Coxiella sp. (in: Bacteria)]|nr:MAG: hypothetical protein COB66_01445 [Coxiella sp. (in: g-proteobacteria)]